MRRSNQRNWRQIIFFKEYSGFQTSILIPFVCPIPHLTGNFAAHEFFTHPVAELKFLLKVIYKKYDIFRRNVCGDSCDQGGELCPDLILDIFHQIAKLNMVFLESEDSSGKRELWQVFSGGIKRKIRI